MRNIFFLLAFSFFCFPVTAQTNIQIILKHSDQFKPEKVDAFDLSSQEIYEYSFKDTLELKFTKTTIDCYNIRYHENGKMFRTQVWLDTGNICIKAHIDSQRLVIDSILHSPTYYEVKQFAKTYGELQAAKDTTAINNFLLDAYRQHMDDPFSLMVADYYIRLNQNSKINLLKLKTFTDKQAGKFAWFALYPVVERLNSILTIDKINISHFLFLTKENKKVNLSLQGADYYVLDFWFLDCPPCVQQHKDIALNLEKLKQKRVELIGISTDEDMARWKAYLTKHHYSWKNYLQDRAKTIPNELDISGFPVYIVINNKGDIIDTYNSFSDILLKFGVTYE